jgi:hypothetical protein
MIGFIQPIFNFPTPDRSLFVIESKIKIIFEIKKPTFTSRLFFGYMK